MKKSSWCRDWKREKQQSTRDRYVAAPWHFLQEASLEEAFTTYGLDFPVISLDRSVVQFDASNSHIWYDWSGATGDLFSRHYTAWQMGGSCGSCDSWLFQTPSYVDWPYPITIGIRDVAVWERPRGFGKSQAWTVLHARCIRAVKQTQTPESCLQRYNLQKAMGTTQQSESSTIVWLDYHSIPWIVTKSSQCNNVFFIMFKSCLFSGKFIVVCAMI